MTSYLGVHFIAEVHAGQHHKDYIAQVRPRIMKTVAGSMPDVQVLSDVYAVAPDAIHYWRNHALSEQHSDLWRNPGATGNRHAEELHAQVGQRYAEATQRGLQLPDRDQVRVLGINEPVTEMFERFEDGRNYAEWISMMRHRAPLLDEYMVTLGARLNALGLGAGLGNFSSGQPANLKPGAYPTFVTWFPRTAALLEQTRGLNALACHEYFTADKGPEGWWDWHTHRFAHYEVDCDIDVLECGVDHGIIGEPLSGWQGRIDAQTYAAQLETYIRRCMTDSRFRGATPFTLDGAREWHTFYIEPAMVQLADLAQRLPVATQQPNTIHIPHVIAPTPPEPTAQPPVVQPVDPIGTFQRALEFVLRWEGGWADNPNDPGGATMQGITLGTFTRWRHAAGMGTPTKDDLRNIRADERDAIYYQWYWLASGAHELAWPLALGVFDTAVNAGVGRAAQMLGDSDGNLLRYMGLLIDWYTRIPNWEHFGKAWIRRRADLLIEMAK
jgi:hypothetical protein